MEPTSIILDCDPGHDDALAILMAIARPEIELLGITTVAGNAKLPQTTRNALAILALADRADIPLAAGADRPLNRTLVTADYVHGTSGLEGSGLPAPLSEPRPEGAQMLLAELLEAAPGPVTLVPTGPLTNIGRLLLEHPDLHDRIGRICLMGGAIGEGNRTASAEFNIWVDPEAAAIVFESGLPVTMIGIDVTHQAVVPVARSDAWADIGNQTGRVFADSFRYFARFHRERYGWDGSPIHDAVAVAHLVEPGLVQTRDYRVEVETISELTRGRTVVDREGLSGLPPNASVGVDLDSERFVGLIEEVLASFP
jgi:pyrimidine-specific ribonucleoside hydrolase